MVSEAAVFSRRAFLQAFLPSLVIAPALAEELIWQPSKTIVLPPVGGWGCAWAATGSNTLFTISYLTNEALRILEADIRIAEGLRFGNQWDGRRYGKVILNHNASQRLRSMTNAWQS